LTASFLRYSIIPTLHEEPIDVVDESQEASMPDVVRRADIKLSHAIREGATRTPQAIWKKTHVGSTCALGAAAAVVGCTINDGGDDALLEFFPELAEQVPAVEEVPPGTLRMLVCSLNNGGRTRETIADMLEAMGY
jgi:hypothetical protein